MGSTVCCNMTSCSLIEVYRRFGGIYDLHFRGSELHREDNKQIILKMQIVRFLSDIAGKLLPDYKVSHPSRMLFLRLISCTSHLVHLCRQPVTGGWTSYCVSYIDMDFLGFWTLSIVRYFKKHTTFRKLDLFPSSDVKKVGKTPIQMGPLERANLNHWLNTWDQLCKLDSSCPGPYLTLQVGKISNLRQ
jgi:hypothetical protein